MLSFTIRRFLILIPTLFFVSFLIYLSIELMPGDVVSFMIPPDELAKIDTERLDELRESLGLNDAFIVRYFNWIKGVCVGDFGYSLTSGVAISEIFKDRLSATIELAIAALLISTVFGCIFGTLSAIYKGSLFDNGLTVLGMFGISIPKFFFGLVCILIFALKLKWLPVGGRMYPGYVSFFDRLPHLIMPALVLGLTQTAGVMRYARSSMLDALNKAYITTARSKGLSEYRVNYVHGFRGALTPIVVLVGFRLPTLIGGSVVIENVFQWPGIGNEFVAAVHTQNTPLIMMIAFFSVLAVLLASFLIDLITALLDPRIRLF